MAVVAPLGKPPTRLEGRAGGTTPATSGGAAVVMTKTGSAGTYLTDGSGKSLYLFVADNRR